MFYPFQSSLKNKMRNTLISHLKDEGIVITQGKQKGEIFGNISNLFSFHIDMNLVGEFRFKPNLGIYDDYMIYFIFSKKENLKNTLLKDKTNIIQLNKNDIGVEWGNFEKHETSGNVNWIWKDYYKTIVVEEKNQIEFINNRIL